MHVIHLKQTFGTGRPCRRKSLEPNVVNWRLKQTKKKIVSANAALIFNAKINKSLSYKRGG